MRPDLLEEWHPSRNGDLDPHTVAAGPRAQAWWRCSECGREWEAVLGDRARRQLSCRTCGYRPGGRSPSRRAKSLVWSAVPTPNGGVAPDQKRRPSNPYAIKLGSERRLWWRCSYCGSEWEAPPGSRRRSARGGCPTLRDGRGRARHTAATRPRHRRQRAGRDDPRQRSAASLVERRAQPIPRSTLRHVASSRTPRPDHAGPMTRWT